MCPVCNRSNNKQVYKNFPGYIQGQSFDIFACQDCSTQFIDTRNLETRVYDLIYQNNNVPGYDRYEVYANQVKEKENPLAYLASRESMYYPVQALLNTQNKESLRILEVGCGRGYLTYSLRKMGHDAVGIDISQKVIDVARDRFGEYFYASSLEDFAPEEKFDLVIATELIEHVVDPVGLIQACVPLLDIDGQILVTTPNRDAAPKDAVWRTDLPPVHTVWLGKQSFVKIANASNLEMDFFDFSPYIGKRENKLMRYILLNKNNLPLPILDIDGNVLATRTHVANPKLRNMIKNSMFWRVFRVFGHWYTRVRSIEHAQLAVIFRKKQQG